MRSQVAISNNLLFTTTASKSSYIGTELAPLQQLHWKKLTRERKSQIINYLIRKETIIKPHHHFSASVPGRFIFNTISNNLQKSQVWVVFLRMRILLYKSNVYSSEVTICHWDPQTSAQLLVCKRKLAAHENSCQCRNHNFPQKNSKLKRKIPYIRRILNFQHMLFSFKVWTKNSVYEKHDFFPQKKQN